MAIMVQIKWVANPFRGDEFAEAWLPAAEAVMDFGATKWAFYRAKDGLLDFIQTAEFENKHDFERYWYSEEISDARATASGLYQVPVLPLVYRVVGAGDLTAVNSSS